MGWPCNRRAVKSSTQHDTRRTRLIAVPVRQDPTGEAAQEAQKQLVFYELDLGLNHVIRKWSEAVDNGANLLIAVPGGANEPGGVLVCAENFVIYKNQDHPELRAVIPRREDLPPERGVLIVTSATHRQKNLFFFLLMSEYGDLYKVTLHYHSASGRVQELRVKYFDTLPPGTGICVFKIGMLFVASEAANHALYRFQGIGDDDAVESSSLSLVETTEGFQAVYFTPRPLTNLALVDSLPALAPICDMKVAQLGSDEVPAIFAACGRGCRATFRALKPGMAVTEMATSELPGQPLAVWTVRRAVADEFDSYIVVSFTNATLVLSIGETVEEVSDSGFLGATPTLQVQLLRDGGLAQVHPAGLRHIRPDRRINEWRAPGRKEITLAATNMQQVVLGLSGGELMYFELDAAGQLQENVKADMKQDVLCLAIGPLPEGRTRSRFIAVGLADATVKILGLDPGDNMRQLTIQSLDAAPSSLLFQESVLGGADPTGEAVAGLFLHVGLANGVLLRIETDKGSGQLSATRQRFLGPVAPKLLAVTVRKQPAMLALSARPWVAYTEQGRYVLTPLAYDKLECGSSFSSDQCPEGLVVVAGITLRIITFERLGERFTQASLRLRYTPRKFVRVPDQPHMVVLEADHQAVALAQRQDVATLLEQQREAGELEGVEFDEGLAEAQEQQGAPLGRPGTWASCLRVVDAAQMVTTAVYELPENEAALSVAVAEVASQHVAGHVVVVGTVTGLKFYPRACQGGAIRLYRLKEGGKLELIHVTKVEGVPLAVAGFQGRILAGVNSVLRLYDIGKKQLLRKCEHRTLPTLVHSIHTCGHRIYVADQQEGFHYFIYRKMENQFCLYADTVIPRHMTAALWLDYDTMVGADKFGNVFVSRLPEEVSEEIESDPTGGKFVTAAGALNGAPHKLEDVINFHVGDVISSLQRCTLLEGGQEVILYATLGGGIGILLPFQTRSEADVFQTLEMNMRLEAPPLCGRDHQAFRSASAPVKDVVDGDLCELFASLPLARRREVGEQMDNNTGEILRFLEEMRNRVI